METWSELFMRGNQIEDVPDKAHLAVFMFITAQSAPGASEPPSVWAMSDNL